VANRDLLAIGTSAGGVDALRHLARGLPADLPAAVLIVIHLSDQFPSQLDEILNFSGPLRAAFAADGDVVERGRIYIGPPGRHLLADGERLRLGVGPPENRSRPSVDPLLRSVALCCGSRAIGVILTGALNDGSSGLRALKQCGGMTVVQDPHDALFSEMPRAALDQVEPDHVVTLAAMAGLLARLVREPAGTPMPAPDNVRLEVAVAAKGGAGMDEMDKIGRRSVFTCPDCHGALWQIDDHGLVRYRCHVGHSYTAEVLDGALGDSLSRALSSALRALEERSALLRSLEKRAREGGRNRLAVLWAEKARAADTEAETIRRSIHNLDDVAPQSAA
jgi:two-component system, chemotaxis family, protein-glutamate methylesterase/glutaminase